jgi:hypothetical protein
VPEVALALIRSDYGLDQKEALKTLRDSVQYGAMMFPDPGDGSMSAGDVIVRERARLRKREVDEEDRASGKHEHSVETDSDVSMNSMLSSEEISNYSNRRHQHTRPRPAKHAHTIANPEQDTGMGENNAYQHNSHSRAKSKRTEASHEISSFGNFQHFLFLVFVVNVNKRRIQLNLTTI